MFGRGYIFKYIRNYFVGPTTVVGVMVLDPRCMSKVALAGIFRTNSTPFPSRGLTTLRLLMRVRDWLTRLLLGPNVPHGVIQDVYHMVLD